MAAITESKKHVIDLIDDEAPLKAAKKETTFSGLVKRFHEAFVGNDEFEDRKALCQGSSWVVNFPVASRIDCFVDTDLPDDLLFELVFDKSCGFNACVRSVRSNLINSFTMSLVTTFSAEQLENLGWSYNRDLLCTCFALGDPLHEEFAQGVTYSMSDDGHLTVHFVNVQVDFDDSVTYSFHLDFDAHTVVVDSDYSENIDQPRIVGDVSEKCRFELSVSNGPDMNTPLSDDL